MSVYSTHNPESSVVRTTHGDPRYREGMRDRGKALDAPNWWLELARAKVRKTKGLIVLGQELARQAGRATPWSHTVLSKFASGEIQPTQELALAVSSHFAIPRPFYIPRDPNEGRAMQAIVDMRTVPVPVPETSRRASDPVTSERFDQLEAKIGDLEEELRQRSAVHSGDGEQGRSRSRGHRGVHRGR
jgi:hypothetical protein